MKFNAHARFLFQEAGDGNPGGGSGGAAPAVSPDPQPSPGEGQAAPAAGDASPGNLVVVDDTTGEEGGQAEPGAQPSPGQASPGEFNFSSLIGVDGQFLPNYAGDLAKAHPDLADGANILSRYKDPVSLAKALVHAQRLNSRKMEGIDSILNVDPSDETGMALKREKLGIPSTAEGYGLKLPDKLPDGTAIPEEFRDAKGQLDEFQKWAFENDIPKATAEKLVAFDMQRTIQQQQAAEQARAAEDQRQLAQDSATLKQELGSDFPRSMDLLVQLLERGGMTREQIRTTGALRDLNVTRALIKLAGESGEDRLPASTGQSSGLDAGAQARDIVNNEQNPLHKAYWAGDEAANTKVQSLLKQEAAAKRQLAR